MTDERCKVCGWPVDPNAIGCTPVDCSYRPGAPHLDGGARALDASEALRAQADLDRLRAACIKSAREITETLGVALYGETPAGAPGPVWAMDTPETLAIDAAERIKQLREHARVALHEAERNRRDMEQTRLFFHFPMPPDVVAVVKAARDAVTMGFITEELRESVLSMRINRDDK